MFDYKTFVDFLSKIIPPFLKFISCKEFLVPLVVGFILFVLGITYKVHEKQTYKRKIRKKFVSEFIYNCRIIEELADTVLRLSNAVRGDDINPRALELANLKTNLQKDFLFKEFDYADFDSDLIGELKVIYKVMSESRARLIKVMADVYPHIPNSVVNSPSKLETVKAALNNSMIQMHQFQKKHRLFN